MAGINGLHIQTEKVFTEKYATMVDSIKQAVPTAKIYLQSILPVNPSMKAGKGFNKEKIARCNELVRKIAEEKGCVYIDLYKLYAVDGIMPHMTDGPRKLENMLKNNMGKTNSYYNPKFRTPHRISDVD